MVNTATTPAHRRERVELSITSSCFAVDDNADPNRNALFFNYTSPAFKDLVTRLGPTLNRGHKAKRKAESHDNLDEYYHGTHQAAVISLVRICQRPGCFGA
jgi:hypothetical protein